MSGKWIELWISTTTAVANCVIEFNGLDSPLRPPRKITFFVRAHGTDYRMIKTQYFRWEPHAHLSNASGAVAEFETTKPVVFKCL